MAKIDRQKQLKTIDAIKAQLQSILKDLDVLRASVIESEKTDYRPSSANGRTLDDVFKVMEARKYRLSRSKLRKLCRTYNIKTLDELLQISPSAFVTYKGIGTTTAYNVREVIESLGIVWSDANTSF